MARHMAKFSGRKRDAADLSIMFCNQAEKIEMAEPT